MTTPRHADAGVGEPSPSGTIKRSTMTTRVSTPDAPVEVVDISMLLSLEAAQVEGEPDIIVELIDLYLEETPRRVAAVRRALEQGEVSALRGAAHCLRGSSASLGARRLAALCDELEGLSGDDLAREGSALLTRLLHEFGCVQRVFADERSRRLHPPRGWPWTYTS